MFVPVAVAWALCQRVTVHKQMSLQVNLVTAVTVKTVVMIMANQEVRSVCKTILEVLHYFYWILQFKYSVFEWGPIRFFINHLMSFFVFFLSSLYKMKRNSICGSPCDTVSSAAKFRTDFADVWCGRLVGNSHCSHITS
jgi:hypothetical protein